MKIPKACPSCQQRVITPFGFGGACPACRADIRIAKNYEMAYRFILAMLVMASFASKDAYIIGMMCLLVAILGKLEAVILVWLLPLEKTQ